MKPIGIMSLIVGVILVCFIGTCIYYVAGVSATIPPIKEYNYSGNITQFSKQLQNISLSCSKIKYQLTEKVGNKYNGLGYDFDIKIKYLDRDLEYSIRYDMEKGHLFTKDKTMILLIGAFDTKNNIGGYGITAIGMKQLVNVFEKEVISKLN